VNARELDEAPTGEPAEAGDPDPAGSPPADDALVAGAPVVVGAALVEPDATVGTDPAAVVELAGTEASVEPVTGGTGWVVVGPAPDCGGIVVRTVVAEGGEVLPNEIGAVALSRRASP